MIKKILIFTLILGLIIGIVLLLRRPITVPELISATPPNNSIQVDLLSPIVFEFKDEVSANDFAISSTPDMSWQIKGQNINTLIATHSPAFRSGTRYVVTLMWKGEALLTHELTALQTQQDIKLIDSMQNELSRDYPLGQKTPYETTSFRVVYSAPLTLQITLKNTDLAPESAISIIRSWVKTNGLDPASHNYIISD